MSGIGKKQRAIEILLTGESIRKAAAITGATERTLYRWLNDPEFKRELDGRQAAIIEEVQAGLIMLASKAVIALGEVLERPEQRSANVKRLAAVSILDQLLHFREYVSFEARLLRLEEEIQNYAK